MCKTLLGVDMISQFQVGRIDTNLIRSSEEKELFALPTHKKNFSGIDASIV